MENLILRYISLHMDGHVQGIGFRYPPWNAFVAQLPPLKGIWSGVLGGWMEEFIELFVIFRGDKMNIMLQS